MQASLDAIRGNRYPLHTSSITAVRSVVPAEAGLRGRSRGTVGSGSPCLVMARPSPGASRSAPGRWAGLWFARSTRACCGPPSPAVGDWGTMGSTNPTSPVRFLNAIKSFRLQRRPLTLQRELAARLGLTQSAVSDYERGRVPTLQRAFEVAIVLGRRVEEVFYEQWEQALERVAERGGTGESDRTLTTSS